MRVRMVLGLAALLAACSGGGGSGNNPTIPSVPWGSFRHDTLNSAVAGLIDHNDGEATLLMDLRGKATLATPAVDRNGDLVIGTSDGIIAFDGNPHCSNNQGQGCRGDSCLPDGGTCVCGSDGACSCSGSGQPCNQDDCGNQGTCTGVVMWVFSEFNPNDCRKSCPSPPCVAEGTKPVGPVTASPTVTAGDTIVFGTDPRGTEPGRIFAIKPQGDQAECLWVFPRDATPPGFGVKSSAATLVYNLDLTLTTAVVGADDGVVRAFNFDGSVRWTVPIGGVGNPITSSPAIDATNNTYVTTADGFVSAIDFNGGLSWRFPTGIAPAAQLFPDQNCTNAEPNCLYPSPAVSTTVYAVGTGGTLFAINPTSPPNLKWQFAAQRPISGSAAFTPQNFNAAAASVLDTVIFVVDEQGTAYGVRDLNGSIMPIQRCSIPPNNGNGLPNSCRTDSCLPFNQMCDTSTNRCTGGANPTQRCTRDSCLPDQGTCTVRNGVVSVTGAAVPIITSPIVSGDEFVVVGTSDGRICARALDGTVPGQDLSPPSPAWAQSGCIAVGNSSPTRSSPAIGLNDTIYAITDAGLYVIR